MNLKSDTALLAALTVLQEEVKRRVDAARAQVLDDMLALHDMSGIKSANVMLPSGENVGTVALIQPKAAGLRITDEAAFIAYLQANDAAALVWHEPTDGYYTVRPGVLEEYANYPLDDVPGVRLDNTAPAPKSFRISVTDKPAVIRAWQSGALGELLPKEAPALAGGE